MAAEGYNPDATESQKGGIAAFVGSAISEDITTVPSIGPVYKGKLADAGASTTYQLIGKFLECKGEGMNTRQHCDAFFYWLKDNGVNKSNHAHVVTRAIAQRCHAWMDGIYNESEL